MGASLDAKGALPGLRPLPGGVVLPSVLPSSCSRQADAFDTLRLVKWHRMGMFMRLCESNRSCIPNTSRIWAEFVLLLFSRHYFKIPRLLVGAHCSPGAPESCELEEAGEQGEMGSAHFRPSLLLSEPSGAFGSHISGFFFFSCTHKDCLSKKTPAVKDVTS